MANKVTITGVCTSNLPKLTSKESDEMLRLIKSGDILARENFIKANMRLVLSMVQRFRDTKGSADDLFQVGMIGLIKSIDNFDINLGVRFSTYAVPMVIGEIKRYLREGTALKVGRSQRDIAFKVMQERERLERLHGKEATLTEISNELQISYHDVVCALDAIAEPVSIYESAYQDNEDSILIVDQIADNRSEYEPLDFYTLKESIKKLPLKEKMIIELRYYQGKTQMEISNELMISQAQISRLEKTAIDRLKKAF